MEIADVNGDGKPVVLHSDAGGELTELDAAGKQLLQTRLGSGMALYFDQFTVCPWPAHRDPPRIIHCEGDKLRLFDGAGRRLQELEAPDAGEMTELAACLVSLRPGAPECLAIAAAPRDPEQVNLYIYDGSGKLLYHAAHAGRL
ncbi:MAG: hypothetical protein HYU66_23100, partial [Armatimonadetes bacterium]|nr:hypothetical protein [Armatimonadota bacterium]